MKHTHTYTKLGLRISTEVTTYFKLAISLNRKVKISDLIRVSKV